jgi:hypothetical protein
MSSIKEQLGSKRDSLAVICAIREQQQRMAHIAASKNVGSESEADEADVAVELAHIALADAEIAFLRVDAPQTFTGTVTMTNMTVLADLGGLIGTKTISGCSGSGDMTFVVDGPVV